MFDSTTFKLMATGTTYPYCDIPSTRNGFRVKWLLFEAKNRTVLFKRGSRYAVPASTLPMETATELIVKKKALPLPQDYADIMDVMDWWGRTVSPSWHATVLDLMHFHLNGKNEKRSREYIFYRCIDHRVSEMLDTLTINSEAAPAIMQQWISFFETTYKYETRDFFLCCVNSFRFVENKINHAQQVSLLAIVTNYNYEMDDNSVGDGGNLRTSQPDIVPPTPVSSTSNLDVTPFTVVSQEN